MGQKVAILGATDKQDRYAYKAFRMLKEYGHEPLPVSPKLQELDGIKAFQTLDQVPPEVDTLTMYVGSETSSKLQNEILQLKPKRVIFNPGSENPKLENALENAGIEVVEGCTLVMLRSDQFDE